MILKSNISVEKVKVIRDAMINGSIIQYCCLGLGLCLFFFNAKTFLIAVMGSNV